MKKRLAFIIGLIVLGLAAAIYFKTSHKPINIDITSDSDQAPPQAVSISPQEINQQPKDISALGGYNVLIADRGNNRLIEVTPDKQIIWQYDFQLPQRGLGADDAFFTDDGQSIIVNLEEDHVIEIIDYKNKTVKWSYGIP